MEKAKFFLSRIIRGWNNNYRKKGQRGRVKRTETKREVGKI